MREMQSLNKELNVQEDNMDVLFEDLMERLEYSACSLNYDPCGVNVCTGVIGQPTFCVKNC